MGIYTYWYNLAKSNIDPLEGYYCSEKCAKLADEYAWSMYDYSNFSSKADNAQFDVNAYGADRGAEVATYDAEAKAAWNKARQIAKSLNDNHCSVSDRCPN
jgi:hypothetical protein